MRWGSCITTHDVILCACNRVLFIYMVSHVCLCLCWCWQLSVRFIVHWGHGVPQPVSAGWAYGGLGWRCRQTVGNPEPKLGHICSIGRRQGQPLYCPHSEGPGQWPTPDACLFSTQLNAVFWDFEFVHKHPNINARSCFQSVPKSIFAGPFCYYMSWNFELCIIKSLREMVI